MSNTVCCFTSHLYLSDWPISCIYANAQTTHVFHSRFNSLFIFSVCENAAQGSILDSNASSSSSSSSGSSSSVSSSTSGHQRGDATWRYESPDVDHSRTSSQSHSSSSHFYTSSSSVSSAFFDFLRHHADGAAAARADTLKLEAQMLSAARSLQQRYVLSPLTTKRFISVDLM
jgi:hypothetical protein